MSWPLYRGINEDDPCHNLGMHPSKRLGMEGRHGMGNKNNLPWLPNVPMPLNQTNEVGQARDFFIQLGIAPRPDSPTDTWTVVGDDVDVLEAIHDGFPEVARRRSSCHEQYDGILDVVVRPFPIVVCDTERPSA